MLNMLLTVSANGGGTNNWIAMGVGGVIIIAAIVLIVLTTKEKKNGDEMLKEFFEAMASRIKDAVIDAIKNINPDDLKGNIPEVYYEITNSIYNSVYDTCYEYIDTIVIDHKSIIAEVVKKALTKEKVQEYVNAVLDNNDDIQAMITEIINIVFKDEVDRQEKEDKERTKELEDLGVIENMDEYLAENKDAGKGDTDKPAQLNAKFEPLVEEINPPKDEEEELKDDGTIEIIETVNVADKLNDDNDDDDGDSDDGK